MATPKRQRALKAVPAATPSAIAGRGEVLRRLELEISRRIDGMLSGDHRATAIAPGSERAGARAYQPGDDARQIDWSLTARTQATHVRTTEADREADTWVVVDRSASMDFGTAEREKREVALAAAAAFGLLGLRGRNRFGVLLVGGEEIVCVQPAVGRTSLIGALSRVDASPRYGAGPPAGADLAGALIVLSRLQRRRGQVVVVSDFLDGSDWVPPLRVLALHHQVIAAHVTDPRELALPAVGLLVAVDPESGRTLHVQTDSTALRERYAAAARGRHDDIAHRIRLSGVEYLHLSTDRDWVLDTVAFALGRRAQRPRVPPVTSRALAGAPR